MKINPVVQQYWNEAKQQFYRSYFGYDMMYFRPTTGGWVYPDDADSYPEEITMAQTEMQVDEDAAILASEL